MLGIKYGTSANASLLGNFEIVATTGTYLLALVVMIAGSVLVVMDTLAVRHTHPHTHTFTHTHDGVTHTHTVTHSHPHTHYLSGAEQAEDVAHTHRHSKPELESCL